jgi:hypothetical protein
MLAAWHAPFVVSRGDQFMNPYTDMPLGLAYHLEPRSGGGLSLVYTMIFSDEDNKLDSRDTDEQMARYGRRTDIEWVYRVDLDARGKVLGRAYHGTLHFKKKFDGGFIPGARNPILYNEASYNVFSDRSEYGLQIEGKLEGYHLAPEDQIDRPQAREQVMLANAWMYDVSDAELAKEGKLSTRSQDYLFVMIDGEIRSGAFKLRLELDAHGRKEDSRVFVSGGGRGSVDRLGEDAWGSQSLSAIPVGRETLEKILGGHYVGTLSLNEAGLSSSADIDIRALRFFRLAGEQGSLRAEDITGRIMVLTCHYIGIRTRCVFGR